jgi:hypothetical protein
LQTSINKATYEVSEESHAVPLTRRRAVAYSNLATARLPSIPGDGFSAMYDFRKDQTEHAPIPFDSR